MITCTSISCSDIILVCTSLFLGAVALAVALLPQALDRVIFPPRLHIDFKQEVPLCRLTFWRAGASGRRRGPVYAFHLEISNTGRSTARRCEVVLEGIWRYDASGKPQRVPDFHPVNVRYGGPGTHFLNLNPGRHLPWNLGHISSAAYQKDYEQKILWDLPGAPSKGLRFLLDLLEYPNGIPNCLAPGNYALSLSLYSENASPRRLNLKIAWSGRWKKTEALMFQEIVISKLDSIE